VNFGMKLVKQIVLKGIHNKGVFWAGPLPFFVITDPEEIQVIEFLSK
jgi:hypothetical protein